MLIALARSRGEGNSAVMMATIADTAPAPAEALDEAGDDEHALGVGQPAGRRGQREAR